MPHQICPATAADLRTLLGLIHLKAEFDGCPTAVTATAEKLNNTLFSSPPLAHILLAEIDSKTPAGFASYHFTYSTFSAQPSLWLDDLFVKDEYRNQAIGTDLIQRLCQIAHEHGCGRIDWTVDIHNQAGIHFYERIGGKLQTQVHLCRLNQAAIAQHVS